MKNNYVILATDIYESLNISSTFTKKIVIYIMNLLVEKISKSGKSDLNVDVSASEFLKRLNLSDSGSNYNFFKNGMTEITGLTTKTLDEDGSQVSCAWFNRCIERDGVNYSLTFNPEIANVIYEIQKSRQALDLSKVCDVKSSHTLRLYDLCLSKRGKRGRSAANWSFEITVEDLKAYFGIAEDSYKTRMNNFNLKVIKAPLTELNNINRDFQVTILNITKCKRIIGYQFSCEWLRK